MQITDLRNLKQKSEQKLSQNGSSGQKSSRFRFEQEAIDEIENSNKKLRFLAEMVADENEQVEYESVSDQSSSDSQSETHS